MVLDISVELVISRIGHDGSEIIWPQLSEPFCRRSFHIQELIDLCWSLNYTVTPFDAVPMSQGQADAEPHMLRMPLPPNERMDGVMRHQFGVLTGETLLGHPHAVAWNGHDCYDPNGTIYDLSRFRMRSFWAIKSA